MLHLRRTLVQQLEAMLHNAGFYVENFASLRESRTSTVDPNDFRMVVDENRSPSTEHLRRYDVPSSPLKLQQQPIERMMELWCVETYWFLLPWSSELCTR